MEVISMSAEMPPLNVPKGSVLQTRASKGKVVSKPPRMAMKLQSHWVRRLCRYERRRP
jgi:hypothetical protein